MHGIYNKSLVKCEMSGALEFKVGLPSWHYFSIDTCICQLESALSCLSIFDGDNNLLFLLLYIKINNTLSTIFLLNKKKMLDYFSEVDALALTIFAY